MRSAEEILQGLDRLFEDHKIEEAEEYLLSALTEAKAEGQFEIMITLVNELIGYYRDTSQYEKSLSYCEQILLFMEQLGLKGTIHYATTCLNVTNAYRAAGKWEESLALYKEILSIYDKILPRGHELYASYYNNLSLLYQEMGEFEKAAHCLKKALEIIEPYQDMIKIATSCSNLAGSLLRIGEIEEAEEYLQRSLTIYQEDGERDFHYGAALSAMGELQYCKKNYSLSYEYYAKALEELEKHVGRTEYYERTLENLKQVEQAMKEAKKKGKEETENKLYDIRSLGMEQCIEFYLQYGKPMLEKKFPSYIDKIAVAVVGEGSHCFQYDDSFSLDHDFYPGFSLFVTQDTYDKIGSSLEAEYARLEQKLMLNDKVISSVAKARTGVCVIEDFYRNILGNCIIPTTGKEWLEIEESSLSAAVNGIVLDDAEGIFTYYRNKLLSYYPKEVWHRKIAQEMYHLSQYGQYNYGRMQKRKDLVTALQCRSFFADSAMKMVYLLNRTYTPYYKWRYRGLDDLDNLGIREKIHALSYLPADEVEDNLEVMENICIIFLRRMEKMGLLRVKEGDTYLEHYIPQILGDENIPSEKKEELVERLVLTEWKAFDEVRNEGGRADCQDDWNTFSLMRKSQYLTWSENMLLSYLEDFKEANNRGWNLITEKYGRMMESTAKDRFEAMKDQFPVIDKDKKRIIEEIVNIQVGWMEEFSKEYPYMAGNSRSIHTEEDSPYNTSFETYLRGEISTYSDRTLDLYGRFIVSYLQQGKNLTKDIMTNTALLYGYRGLKEAEEMLSRA